MCKWYSWFWCSIRSYISIKWLSVPYQLLFHFLFFSWEVHEIRFFGIQNEKGLVRIDIPANNHHTEFNQSNLDKGPFKSEITLKMGTLPLSLISYFIIFCFYLCHHPFFTPLKVVFFISIDFKTHVLWIDE